MTIKKCSFLSYDTRGDYNLKPLTYGVHHIVVLLVDPVGSPLVKYLGKDRYHRTGVINLYLGSCGQLMDLGEVQKYSHTPWVRKTIRQTNFVCICLFYRLFQKHEYSHQKRIIIHPQFYHKFQPWYKGQVPHKGVQTWCKSQPQCQSMYLQVHSRAPLDSTLPRLRSWLSLDMTHKNQYRIVNLYT